MTISVIVPIYKVEEYLPRCVDSIIAQSYKDIEIILVDDGSPDHCPQICDEYAKIDTRIRVIHKPNGGLSDARNAGIAAASGEWLSFIDSDDWIEADMLECLLNNALKYQAQISVGGISEEIFDGYNYQTLKTTYDGTEHIESLTPIQAMKRHLLGSWAAWDKIYRRELYEDLRFPFGEINEDEAIMLHLLERCNKIVYTNKPFYHYIHRTESITTASFSKKKLAWIDHCLQNLEWVRDNYSELEEFALRRLMNSLLWAMREMALSDEVFTDEIALVKKEIRKQFSSFVRLKSSISQKARLYMNTCLPFSIYRPIERFLSRRGNDE